MKVISETAQQILTRVLPPPSDQSLQILSAFGEKQLFSIDFFFFYFPWPKLIQGCLRVIENSNISGNNCTNMSIMTHLKTNLVSNKVSH